MTNLKLLVKLATQNFCDVEDALIAVRRGETVRAEALLDDAVNHLIILLTELEQYSAANASGSVTTVGSNL